MLAQQWQVRGGNRPLSAFQHTVEKHTEWVFKTYILILTQVPLRKEEKINNMAIGCIILC